MGRPFSKTAHTLRSNFTLVSVFKNVLLLVIYKLLSFSFICSSFTVRFLLPPAVSAPAMSPYGQPPPRPAYPTMAPPTPPTQQITNQMSAMSIGGYGKFSWQFLTLRMLFCTVVRGVLLQACSVNLFIFIIKPKVPFRPLSHPPVQQLHHLSRCLHHQQWDIHLFLKQALSLPQ